MESGLECSDVSINLPRSRCLHIRSSILSINACISVCGAPLFSFDRQIEKSRQRNVGISGVLAFSELEDPLAEAARFIRVVNPEEPDFFRAAIWRAFAGGTSTTRYLSKSESVGDGRFDAPTTGFGHSRNFCQKRVRSLSESASEAFGGACPKVSESVRIGDFPNVVNFISSCVVSRIASCH